MQAPSSAMDYLPVTFVPIDISNSTDVAQNIEFANSKLKNTGSADRVLPFEGQYINLATMGTRSRGRGLSGDPT
jgi:hypothetical protein